MSYKPFKAGRAWGVHSPDGTLYEAMFTHRVAKAVCDEENGSRPPKDWAATKRRLLKKGFSKRELECDPSQP